MFLAACCANGAELSYSDLVKQISAYDDPYITVEDLAFVLATHNFNAIPENEWVIVVIGPNSYKLVPNGDKPGLADIVE
jgi:hypothetical protein